MWQNLVFTEIAPLNLIIRGVIVYVSVLLLLRLGGKREMGQMSPTEFVAILLISNAVQNSMNGGDNSLVGGLLLATILVVMSWAVSYLAYRSSRFRNIFEGTPSLLVRRGHLIEQNLKKERLSHAELRGLLRRQGIHDLSEIHSAILESDGSLSIIRESDIKSEPHKFPSNSEPS